MRYKTVDQGKSCEKSSYSLRISSIMKKNVYASEIEFSIFKIFKSHRRDLNDIFFQRIKVKNANDVFFAVHLQITIAPLCDRHDIKNEKCAPFRAI